MFEVDANVVVWLNLYLCSLVESACVLLSSELFVPSIVLSVLLFSRNASTDPVACFCSCRWLPASSTDAQMAGTQGDSPACTSRASPFFAVKPMSPWAYSSPLAPFPTSSPKTQLALGPFLAELPHDLFLSIVSFMAPTDQLQDVAKYPHGAPNITPALLPSDPSTWEQLVVIPVVVAAVAEGDVAM